MFKVIANKFDQKTNAYFGWFVLCGVGLVQLVSNASGSLNLSIFIVPMSADLGFSRTLFSGAISAGSVLAALFSIPIGFLFDLRKTRQVLIASVILMAAATYSMSLINEWILLYLLISITRMLFTTPMMVGGSVIVSKWFMLKRGRANGILYAFHSIGMIVFPVFGALFIVSFGWRDSWVYLSYIVLLALLPVLIFVYEEPKELKIERHYDADLSNLNMDFSLREALNTKALWIIAFGTGILYLFHSGINSHQAAFLQERGISLGLSSLVISINAISTGLGSVFWGYICDKFSIKYAFSSVFVCSLIALLLLIYTNEINLAILSAVFFGAAMGGMLTVPAVGYATYFGTNSLGKIRGFTNPLSTAGAASGVMVSGIFYDIYGSYVNAFWLYFIISILMLIVSLFLNKPSIKNQNHY
tara:strand:- start:23 stop:1270 length:1248 start_codon:yes stop_codon:yes gene_type:complete